MPLLYQGWLPKEDQPKTANQKLDEKSLVQPYNGIRERYLEGWEGEVCCLLLTFIIYSFPS